MSRELLKQEIFEGEDNVIDIGEYKKGKEELTREERLKFLTVAELFFDKEGHKKARILEEEGEKEGLYTIEIEENGKIISNYSATREQLDIIESLIGKLKEEEKRVSGDIS